VDVAKSQFRVTWGFRFPSMLQRVRSISYRLVLKTKSSGRTTVQESVLFEMTDKSLRVKLVVVSLLEHNFNQRISHFRSFNSTRKVNTDERFASFSFKPNIALPNVKLLSLFLSLQFHWNFICLSVLSKTYMMPFFRKWPSPGLNKQSWCWKNFICLTFSPDTATQRQVIDFFYHHDLAKVLFTSTC